jgi:hypothetical protein
VQRLFSTFADGLPGAGLLIQRLPAGIALVYCAVAKPGGSVGAPQVIGALAGILLIAGFWTPVAGVLAGCAEAWVALSSPAHIGNFHYCRLEEPPAAHSMDRPCRDQRLQPIAATLWWSRWAITRFSRWALGL